MDPTDAAFTPATWQAIGLTLQLASVTTVILLLIATPIAWWLSQTSSRWRAPVGAVVALPLVLPPTVLGFYLLTLLSPQGLVGTWFSEWGVGRLTFSFTGLVIGSVIFSLPFAVQPLQHAFTRLPIDHAALRDRIRHQHLQPRGNRTEAKLREAMARLLLGLLRSDGLRELKWHRCYGCPCRHNTPPPLLLLLLELFNLIEQSNQLPHPGRYRW